MQQNNDFNASPSNNNTTEYKRHEKKFFYFAYLLFRFFFRTTFQSSPFFHLHCVHTMFMYTISTVFSSVLHVYVMVFIWKISSGGWSFFIKSTCSHIYRKFMLLNMLVHIRVYLLWIFVCVEQQSVFNESNLCSFFPFLKYANMFCAHSKFRKQ